MSAENKAVVRRYFDEIWNKRNTAVIDELFAPNYVNHDPSGPDFGRGPECIRRMTSFYLAAFPDTRFTIDEQIAEGDKVLTRWTVRGTHQGDLRGLAPTGRKVTFMGMTISRISNGKIVEDYDVWDALGMMQQLGAVPEQARGFAAR